MGGFSIARVAGDPAIVVQEMNVALLALSPTPCRHGRLLDPMPEAADPRRT